MPAKNKIKTTQTRKTETKYPPSRNRDEEIEWEGRTHVALL
jgi:hypothetical protein